MPGLDAQRQLAETAILFRGVAPSDTDLILAAGTRLELAAGEYVYRQGDLDGRFYLLVSGEVELTVGLKGGQQTVVGHIGIGGHFGETSLLTGAPNSVSVLTLTRVTLLSFNAGQFATLLLGNPTIHRRISESLAQRLRVSFLDHATGQNSVRGGGATAAKILDESYFLEKPAGSVRHTLAQQGLRSVESTIARQIKGGVAQFAKSQEALLILGEPGTGRRMAAYEIHAAGDRKNGPYEELDVRTIAPGKLEELLYGAEGDNSGFSQVAGLGLFERAKGGTVVLYNAECLLPDLQRQLAQVVRGGSFSRVGGSSGTLLQTRLILICRDDSGMENGQEKLLPELYRVVAANRFRVAPLRRHRRDIPRLVNYYLMRFNHQYGKEIPAVDEQTLAMFMNYDWPGNLAEMSSVIQRAVIIGKNHTPLRHEIVIGMPKPEGKWEYNLLRLRPIKAFLTSRFFPETPRLLVGGFLIVLLGFLFFGPLHGEDNIGLTLAWVVGWPLLIFAFFFLGRIWCSICGLSVPGWLIQLLLKPQRATPQFIRRYSGWLMATLCITLFWVEIAFNAYESPRLTGGIVLTVTTGSLVFSIFFKRRVWCRYLCPLGAINALFSMPSVLELRANTHMCMNRCADYACYAGEEGENGCPMFRHPFLVDNNRDCILCGQCIKNCRLNSVHLNLRLAPQELWNQQSPRIPDSVLVVSLAAIFFPFIFTQNYQLLLESWSSIFDFLPETTRLPILKSLIFFGSIVFYVGGYVCLSAIMARLTATSWRQTMALFGYGMIPLVLGAFMAAHLEIFVNGIWLLVKNLEELAGYHTSQEAVRLISRDATAVLQIITICGALIASLYATHRIVQRLAGINQYPKKLFWLPGSLLCISAVVYFLCL